MEFLEKLIARTRRALPLKAGSFSDLAADARSEHWIDQCVADLSSQETSFATNLLMRALRAADSVVARIESEKSVLAYFEGASRDVLLYEVLHFFLHAFSDELRRRISSDAFSASIHFSDLACLAAVRLGRQHVGEFDASQHRLERAKQYLRHVGSPRDMIECLIDILLCTRGRMSIQLPEEPFVGDIDIEVQINLRDIVHPVAGADLLEGSNRLSSQYEEKFDYGRYESERAVGR